MDSARQLNFVSDTLEILSSIYNFFSGSVVHEEFLKQQKLLKTDIHNNILTLKRPADTRWVSRYECCLSVWKNLNAILNTLEVFEQSPDIMKRTKTAVLQSQIDTFFVSALCILLEGLEIIKRLSVALQKEQLNYSDAVDMIKATKDSLAELPTAERFDGIWSKITQECLIAGIPEPHIRQRRRVRDDYSASRKPNTKDEFRELLMQLMIDCMIDEMNRRFTEESSILYHGISALVPKSPMFLNEEYLLRMAKIYDIDPNDIKDELRTLKKLLPEVSPR